jgi:hypothetical protein
MKTIKRVGERVLRVGERISCICCESYEMAIKYDWGGTGQVDLDTKTEAFNEQVGWQPFGDPCGMTLNGNYVLWLVGGSGAQDDTKQDGFERVNVKVNTAKTNGLWTSSYNINCYAGWYSPSGGSGSALLEVNYRGSLKSVTISPGSQSGCADTLVAIVTVYATALEDGTFFEIT